MGSRSATSCVFLGHHLAGKSSLVGHLVCLNDDKVMKVEGGYLDGSGNVNSFASLCDPRIKSENQLHTTLIPRLHQLNCSNLSLPYPIDLIDSPGHRKYKKMTIAALVLADFAVLVVSAIKEEFQENIQPHIGQTWEHIVLAFAFGIKNLIVCVNKMDHPSIAYSQTKYNIIVEQLKKILLKCGFRKSRVQFVPISTAQGTNIAVAPSIEIPWCQISLIECFKEIPVPLIPLDGLTTFLVHKSEKISGIGHVAYGKLLSGSLSIGQEITIGPNRISAFLKSIESHYINLTSDAKVEAGDLLSLALMGVNKRQVNRGNIIYIRKEQLKIPYIIPTNVIAKIKVLNPENERIREGFTSKFIFATGDIHTKITKIISRNGEQIDGREELMKGDKAIIQFSVPDSKPIEIKPFVTCPLFGRFVVISKNFIAAIGTVESVYGDSGQKPKTKMISKSIPSIAGRLTKKAIR